MFSIYLAVLVCSVVSFTLESTPELNDAEQIFEKGLRMLLESKTPELGNPAALELVSTAAKMGHPKAKEIYATASALSWGGLPAKSTQEIFKQFQMLALEGNPRGQLGLGIMYAAGIGLDVNIPNSLIYISFAALGGDDIAEMALGYRYWAGVGVESNCETALAFYRRVASKVAKTVGDRFRGDSSDPSSNLAGPTVVRINLLEERETSAVSTNAGAAALSNYFISDDVLAYYKFLAETNNVTALLTLGQLYYSGQHGIAFDQRQALYYFNKAANSGSTIAMAYLGEMYLLGSPDVPRDETLALNYLQRAVSGGNPMALTTLGSVYLYGRAGLTPDPVKAMELLIQAADKGYAEAQLQLGLLFMGTLDTKSDHKLAVKYFTLASQQGNVLAFYNLGLMHESGLGVFRSCSTATELFKNVAERGRWSQLLTSAYLHYWAGNYAVAFVQYASLAELGYEVAQSNAALILEDGDAGMVPDSERYERALVYWKRSASQGSAMSRVKLGDYHYYGLGTSVNYEQAIQEYRLASDVQRNAQAMFNLAYMHEHGLGFKRDFHLAKRFYDMAAETSMDAQIPVALALTKLAVHYVSDYFWKTPVIRALSDLFVTPTTESGHTDEVPTGMDWDFYAIPLLAGFLVCLLVYIRHQR